MRYLTSETVQSAALSLESVHYVKSSDSLAAGMLSIGHSVANHILEEHFQYTSCLLVNETRDTLDTTSSCETADCGLCDALDVISENLAMSLGSALA